MKINNPAIFEEASAILKTTYGSNAQFRPGQYEAIEATMEKRRTLVVQKTGWGKSLVYFICTKMKRKRNQGMTLVISPLLVLMDNQMEMAQSMGLRCAALNSTVRDKTTILAQMAADRLDMVFITPETLLKEETQPWLPKIRIGLFVVDEAHCISDWGHDFRLDYGKLGRIISGAFSNVAVLATTATANERVIDDLKNQLGNDVYISRGSLTRESLHIQVLPLEKRSERYAWLLENLPKLPGTGIIYCLDRRDCEYLANFLRKNKIPVMSYYSRSNQEEELLNDEAMAAFKQNQIKAIVATIKLGMGYDKGDISFVIHFQSPANIVAWYQQIGRAGRNLKDAYVFLMAGREDDDINEYFIKTAFPTKNEATKVMELISNASGISKSGILSGINARLARVEKALYFMDNEGFIYKKGAKYYSTANKFVYNGEHYQAISDIRRQEMRQMRELINTNECYSRFAVNCLDDHSAGNCGKCANCTGEDIFPGLGVSPESVRKAVEFMAMGQLEIEPRKQWPDKKKIPEQLQLQKGICLSRYGDPGYGELVAQGKYPSNGAAKGFSDALVARSAVLLQKWIREQGITHITCVPSLRSDLVKDFTLRLAQRTGLCFVELLRKSPAPEQKNMENSAFQCKNAQDSFAVLSSPMPQKVILVDDMVDSRWTLTVCGYKILESGCRAVYPFALADSSHMEE